MRVDGLIVSRGTIVRHGPSSWSAATIDHVHSTATLPFAITQGDGLLQPGKEVCSGMNGPSGEALVWIVLPSAIAATLSCGEDSSACLVQVVQSRLSRRQAFVPPEKS